MVVLENMVVVEGMVVLGNMVVVECMVVVEGMAVVDGIVIAEGMVVSAFELQKKKSDNSNLLICRISIMRRLGVTFVAVAICSHSGDLANSP